MAVTIDLGEANNIHPTDKYTVAKRLLPYVKSLVYGEQTTHKSPIYQSHTVQGANMILSFDNVGSGLTTVKPITEFEIAGSDKVYKIATASLMPDNRISIANATVPIPVYARYAFLNFPTVSIFTTDTLPLPLSPFKTESGGTLTLQDLYPNTTQLKAYPNPTRGTLTIQKESEPSKIEVFDLTGKMVYIEKFSEKLDLSFLTKGMYFVRTDLNQIVKIVIE